VSLLWRKNCEKKNCLPQHLFLSSLSNELKGGIMGNEGETLITPIMEGDDSLGKNVEI